MRLPEKPAQEAPAWLEKPGLRRKAKPKGKRHLEEVKQKADFASVFADEHDPENLSTLLEEIRSFVEKHPIEDIRAESFAEAVTQSKAPFEVVVAFTILTAMVSSSSTRQRKYAMPLERGAKVFYNLAKRLNPKVEIPPRIAARSVDVLFYDLADLALQIPYAYAADAFCRLVELLEEPMHPKTVEMAREMRMRFIERRTFGDQALRDIFPPPDWDSSQKPC